MLVNAIREVSDSMRHYAELRETTDRCSRLSRLSARLHSAVEKRKSLNESRCAIDVLCGSSQPEVPKSRAAEHARSILTLLDGGNIPDLNDVQPLEGALNQESMELKGIWATQVAAMFRSFRDTCSTLSGILEDTEQLNAIRSSSDTLERTWPVRLEHAHQAEELAKAATASITELGLSNEVRDFLARVASGKATLADVTPGAASWLLSHGLMTRVRISFLSPTSAARR